MTEQTTKPSHVTMEQLPDCEERRWYVTDCSVKGVIGINAPSFKEITEMLPHAIETMKRLNR